jgi:hypothetical protein
MNLTTEQLAKLIFATNHQSRRKAKRFMRDWTGDGSAEALDLALALVDSHPDRAAIESRSNALAAEHAERERDVRASLDRGRSEREALDQQLLMLAAGGDPRPLIIDAVGDDGTRDHFGAMSDKAIEAALAYGDYTPLTAAELLDLNETYSTYDELVVAVQIAICEAITESAMEALRGRARPGGRYAAYQYYRKTLRDDSNCQTLEFDDPDDAAAYITLCGYKGSSYNATVLDRQEER